MALYAIINFEKNIALNTVNKVNLWQALAYFNILMPKHDWNEESKT